MQQNYENTHINFRRVVLRRTYSEYLGLDLLPPWNLWVNTKGSAPLSGAEERAACDTSAHTQNVSQLSLKIRNRTRPDFRRSL